MSTIDERPRLDESYARATRATDLSASTEHRTDADVLLAAGYAAQGNRNGRVALMAYRMKISGDRSQKAEIVEALMDMVAKKVARRTLPSVNRARSRVIVETVIGWWANDNCEVCTGRKMEPIPGTPHLSANWCSACNGLGTRAIPDQGPRFNPHARWLAAELDMMLAVIVGQMAKRLAPQLDLNLDKGKSA